MFSSPIDRKDVKLIKDTPVIYETTYFKLKGSILELSGYATMRDIFSYTEDRSRKTLLFVKEIDLVSYRKELLKQSKNYATEWELLTDDEIIDKHTVKVAMDNCYFSDVENNSQSNIEDNDSLGGFRISVDLAKICDGKPLFSGNYNLFIKLEQLPENRDDIKYEKIIPLADITNFL